MIANSEQFTCQFNTATSHDIANLFNDGNCVSNFTPTTLNYTTYWKQTWESFLTCI